jgi:cytochrome-b5 reductase
MVSTFFPSSVKITTLRFLQGGRKASNSIVHHQIHLRHPITKGRTTTIPPITRRLYCLTALSLFSTMSKATYAPPSLGGKPMKVLVPPGQCQFHDDWTTVSLIERVQVSPTSSLLRFGLPDTSLPLNLSTCACILAKASMKSTTTSNDDDEGVMEDVIRPYTPVSTNALKGCFDLLIKDYGPNGKMSHHMCHTMSVGDAMDFKHIEFNVKIQAPFTPKKIVCLVGGTGITPMIQALHAVLGDPESTNEVIMLYGSRESSDILGKTMIDSWAAQYPEKLKVVHILSDEPADSEWTGRRGHITKEIMEEFVPCGPEHGDDIIVFICGPPPMYNALSGPRGEDDVKGLLGEMGYSQNQVYKF